MAIFLGLFRARSDQLGLNEEKRRLFTQLSSNLHK
jgi:hypothetical protein